MERVTGVGPVSSVWKTDIITVIRYPRVVEWNDATKGLRRDFTARRGVLQGGASALFIPDRVTAQLEGLGRF